MYSLRLNRRGVVETGKEKDHSNRRASASAIFRTTYTSHYSRAAVKKRRYSDDRSDAGSCVAFSRSRGGAPIVNRRFPPWKPACLARGSLQPDTSKCFPSARKQITPRDSTLRDGDDALDACFRDNGA